MFNVYVVISFLPSFIFVGTINLTYIIIGQGGSPDTQNTHPVAPLIVVVIIFDKSPFPRCPGFSCDFYDQTLYMRQSIYQGLNRAIGIGRGFSRVRFHFYFSRFHFIFFFFLPTVNNIIYKLFFLLNLNDIFVQSDPFFPFNFVNIITKMDVVLNRITALNVISIRVANHIHYTMGQIILIYYCDTMYAYCIV